MSRGRHLAQAGLGLALVLTFAPAGTDAADCSAHSDAGKRLVCRVAARAALMRPVAAYKAANGRSIYDSRREAEVLRNTRSDTDDSAATLIFTQIQMDLAKQLQAGWIRAPRDQDSVPARSLEELRTELNALGAAIATDLAVLRAQPRCDQNGLREQLEAALTAIGAPLEEQLQSRFSQMLAAAACAGA